MTKPKKMILAVVLTLFAGGGAWTKEAFATEDANYIQSRIAANTYVDSRFPMGQFSGIRFLLQDVRKKDYSSYPNGFAAENIDAINLAGTEHLPTLSRKVMKPYIDDMCAAYEEMGATKGGSGIFKVAELMNQAAFAEAEALYDHFSRIDDALSEAGRKAVNNMMLVDPRISPKPTKRINAVGLANDIPDFLSNQARITCYRHTNGRLPDDVLANFERLKANPPKIIAPELNSRLARELSKKNEISLSESDDAKNSSQISRSSTGPDLEDL